MNNGGHTFGDDLAEEERMDLIEYSQEPVGDQPPRFSGLISSISGRVVARSRLATSPA